MSDGKKYYCFCGSNCKYETLTKEQILTAITQAASGEAVIDPDAGVLTKVKETNSGGYVTFWVGTQAEYNVIETKQKNCLYIITDDTTKHDIERTAADLQQRCEKVDEACAAVTKAVAEFGHTTWVLESKDIQQVFGLGGGERLYNPYVLSPIFRYSPLTGIMFFQFTMFINGSMSAGEQMTWEVKGVPQKGTAAPFSINRSDVTGVPLQAYYAGNVRNRIVFTATEDFDTKGEEQILWFDGWYFCDGEV